MLDKLEMFIALARERHFGRAAESLGITQPTLSSGLKQLEAQLGVQLVFRGSRYGGLTPEGQAALIWARRIVGDARQLKDEMRAAHLGLAGQLRIAAIPTALTWVSQLSSRFSERHQDVRFSILSRTSEEILTMLDNLEVDAGISYLDNEPTGRVSTVPLYEEQFVAVCAEHLRLADAASVTWKELASERLCLLTPDMQNRRIVNANFAAAGKYPDTILDSNSTVVLVSRIMRGDCVTVLPEDTARFLSDGKRLRLIPIEGQARLHKVGLIAPYREPHTPVLAALLAEARRMAKTS